jgi:hypothetical protein
MNRVTQKAKNINVNIDWYVVTGKYIIVVEDAALLYVFGGSCKNKDEVNLSWSRALGQRSINMFELVYIDYATLFGRWGYWSVYWFVIMKTQRDAAFSIIVLFLKNMNVILVSIHKEEDQIPVLLVARDKKLEVADCLGLGVTGERDSLVFVLHNSGFPKVCTTKTIWGTGGVDRLCNSS